LRCLNAWERDGYAATSDMRNAVIQAWLNCGNIYQAESSLAETRSAGLADETSFLLIIKAHLRIRDFERARKLIQEMKEAIRAPSSELCRDILDSLAQEGLFSDGIALLQYMHKQDVETTYPVLHAIARLLQSARAVDDDLSLVYEVISKYDFASHGVAVPGFARTIHRAMELSTACSVHGIEAKGSQVALKSLQNTYVHHGLIDEEMPSALPVFSDEEQDYASRRHAAAILKCVSKNGLGLPSHLEGDVLGFVASSVFSVHVDFECQNSGICRALLQEISCCHPLLGFRHSWAMPNAGNSCGQRALSNGEDISEASFNRHINADIFPSMHAKL